jgi:phosphoribosylanthranilate isomerase
MLTQVKVCGITRVEDARAATRMGVDFLGVIFYQKSPRCAKGADLDDLILAIPDGRRVMVDVAPDSATLKERVDMGFDYCQVHFDNDVTTRDRVENWSAAIGPQRLWLAPRLKPGEVFPAYLYDLAEVFVIDSYKKGEFGGTGTTNSWERFARLRLERPDKRFILAGGLGPDNISAALDATRAKAVDLNSGVESAPGVKDMKKIATTLDAIRKHA